MSRAKTAESGEEKAKVREQKQTRKSPKAVAIFLTLNENSASLEKFRKTNFTEKQAEGKLQIKSHSGWKSPTKRKRKYHLHSESHTRGGPAYKQIRTLN